MSFQIKNNFEVPAFHDLREWLSYAHKDADGDRFRVKFQTKLGLEGDEIRHNQSSLAFKTNKISIQRLSLEKVPEIREIAECFDYADFKEIKVFDMRSCGWSRLPDLSLLTRLEDVAIAGNHFENLSKVTLSPNVKYLFLGNDGLTEFPDFVKGCPVLRELSLANNQLTEIPESLLDWCPCLSELDLSHNQLTEIPDSLIESSQLSVFSFENNPFLFISKKMMAKFPDLSSVKLFKAQLEYKSKTIFGVMTLALMKNDPLLVTHYLKQISEFAYAAIHIEYLKLQKCENSEKSMGEDLTTLRCAVRNVIWKRFEGLSCEKLKECCELIYDFSEEESKFFECRVEWGFNNAKKHFPMLADVVYMQWVMDKAEEELDFLSLEDPLLQSHLGWAVKVNPFALLPSQQQPQQALAQNSRKRARDHVVQLPRKRIRNNVTQTSGKRKLNSDADSSPAKKQKQHNFNLNISWM